MAPPLQRVDEWTLRAIFQTARCLERLQSGELRPKLLQNRHPSKPKAREPRCTHSQIVAYLTDQGKVAAIVHQYRRTDGTLGASGKPDPKRVFHRGVVYILEE
jgi:hypothetical protein